MKERKPDSRRAVCMVGESSLVSEYASLCSEKGFAVQRVIIRESHRPTGQRFRPRGGIRLVARPSRSVNLGLELSNASLESKRKNLALLDASLKIDTLILTSSLTVTVAEQSAWVRHPERLVGISALPSLLSGGVIEFAVSPATGDGPRKEAEEFAASLGKQSVFVHDSVGMVLPRILCCLANEAMFAYGEGVAGSGDIDNAMKLGTNYPFGPFEWTERIGVSQVFAVMQSLHASFGEDRYRPAPALRSATEREHLR